MNVVIGRLLNAELKELSGNKVLSNTLIAKVLSKKLYGKYLVSDFFASSSKGSETVRNTWTRMNFSSSDPSGKGSKYKKQTWSSITRCGFDDVSEQDQAEMTAAFKDFEETGRFVAPLEVALKGIITEEFVCLLMNLRKEWNQACAMGDESAIAAFLNRYGLNSK